MSTGGRAAREAGRSRSSKEISMEVDAFAKTAAPWLLSGTGAPKAAHTKLIDLRKLLSHEARTQLEAVAFSDALLAVVEDWNAEHSGEEIAAPAPVVVLNARPPAWTAQSLKDMRAARQVYRGFEAAYRELPSSTDEDPVLVAGLALASCLFDSACLHARALALFAAWLADPEGPVYEAHGLPPWIDLKHRGAAPRKNSTSRRLRKVSGSDSLGDYALRRLFLAPRTLELVALHDSLGGTGEVLKAAANNGPRLEKLIRQASTTSVGLGLRRLMRGALMMVQSRPDGPDHTMALLAGRRMESFAATPESWTPLVQNSKSPERSRSSQTSASDLISEATAAAPEVGRPIPEDRAFFQLQNTLSDGKKARSDLTTPGKKLTEGTLIGRLRALPWDNSTPSCLRLLRDWYLELLETQNDSVNSIRRYHSTLAAALCDMSGAVSLETCDADTLEELYTLILETDARSILEQARLRQRLGALHAFALSHDTWDFPEIEPGLLQGEGGVTRIKSTLLDRSAINRARDILRTDSGLAPDVARAVDAVMLVMSRAGLRIGEATKALYSHFENTRHSGLDQAEAVLFVRPSIFGNNKTSGAYRQIKLLNLMTTSEAEEFQEYLSHRRGLSANGPLFGVAQKDSSVAPFHGGALGTVIAGSLRRATGLADASSHALRRAAANDLFLTLHEAQTKSSTFDAFLTDMTGWSREDRTRIAETVAPRSQSRDVWHAMARHLGHGAPSTSFEAYITVADLAVFETCSVQPANPETARRLAVGLSKRHIRLDRVVSDDGGGRRSEITGAVTSPALALFETLTRIDDGDPPDRAARSNYLPVDFIEVRVPIATDWSSLTTNRKRRHQMRLQPPERIGKLAPTPIASSQKRVEAISLADAIIDLAAKQPGAVRHWVCTTLHDATLGNSGTRLRTPSDLKAWCAIAIQLRPAVRWQVERVDPLNASKEDQRAWADARPRETRSKLSTRKTSRSIVSRVRLLRPDTSNTTSGNPTGSWAGCVRFAAHLAAVYLAYDATDL